MLGPTNLPLRSPTELHLVNGPVAIPTGSPLQAVDDHTTWDPSLLGQLQADCRRSMRMVHAAAVRLKADARQMRNVTRHEPSNPQQK